jgi:hypothetical protein
LLQSLYWLSLSEFVYYGSIPAVVLLLTLERSLTLKFPLSWLTRKFPLISIFAFFCIVMFNTAGHLVELPLDYTLGKLNSVHFSIYIFASFQLPFASRRAVQPVAIVSTSKSTPKSFSAVPM